MRAMKRTLRAYLVVGAAAFPTTGSLHAQASSGAACYRFDRSYFQWVGRPPAGGSVSIDSSRIVRLDVTAHTSRGKYPPPDARSVFVPAMRVDSFTTQQWLGMSFWRPLELDSVELIWHNGLFGPVFRLSRKADSLVGHVRFTTDVAGAEPPAQPASAVRIRCP
jgi:hypothetical protein